jgi:hypothetical protein
MAVFRFYVISLGRHDEKNQRDLGLTDFILSTFELAVHRHHSMIFESQNKKPLKCQRFLLVFNN